MSFEPRPSVAKYHMSASSAAGFSRVVARRVAASIAAAPASIASMSIPWSAAGNRPTAHSSLVRPPTQSHIGKRASQPSFWASWSSLRIGPGHGHEVLGEVKARRPEGLRGLQLAVARLDGAARL